MVVQLVDQVLAFLEALSSILSAKKQQQQPPDRRRTERCGAGECHSANCFYECMCARATWQPEKLWVFRPLKTSSRRL